MSQNYFNSLPLRRQLDELGTCRFMDISEFENGIEDENNFQIQEIDFQNGIDEDDA